MGLTKSGRIRNQPSVKEKSYRTRVKDLVDPQKYCIELQAYFDNRKNTEDKFMRLDLSIVESESQVIFDVTYSGVRGNSPSDIEKVALRVSKKANELNAFPKAWETQKKILSY